MADGSRFDCTATGLAFAILYLPNFGQLNTAGVFVQFDALLERKRRIAPFLSELGEAFSCFEKSIVGFKRSVGYLLHWAAGRRVPKQEGLGMELANPTYLFGNRRPFFLNLVLAHRDGMLEWSGLAGQLNMQVLV